MVNPKEAPHRTHGKKDRAVCILKSYLTACGIEHRQSGTSRCDLTVLSPKGDPHEVAVLEDLASIPPDDSAEAIIILAPEITSPNKTTVLRAFHALTERTEHGSPLPVDRGPAPTKRAHYRDDLALSIMRTPEYRLAPNPPDAKFEQYQPVINRICKSFYYRAPNRLIYERHLIDLQELTHTYGRIWLSVFLHNWEISDSPQRDNERLFARFLQQRLIEMVQKLSAAERNYFPDPDTLQVSTYGEIYDEATEGITGMAIDGRLLGNSRVDTDDCDPTEKERESRVARRRQMKTLLEQELSKLPHDEMVEKLTDATTNGAFCTKTQAAARRYLAAHKGKCSKCNSNVADVSPLVSLTLEQRFFAQMPDFLDCRGPCKRVLPKAAIGVRTQKRDENRVATRVTRQSYCTDCRNKKKKKGLTEAH